MSPTPLYHAMIDEAKVVVTALFRELMEDGNEWLNDRTLCLVHSISLINNDKSNEHTTLEEAHANNLTIRVENRSVNNSYVLAYNNFKKFIDKKRQENCADVSGTVGNNYLERGNVDYYFSVVVANMQVSYETANRIQYALQHYIREE